MIYGLSWPAWLLLAFSTLPGVLLVLAFYLRYRGQMDK